MTKAWKHDELMSDLAAFLVATRERMVWCDMQLGPSGSPRPDVYTIAKSYTKPNPLAYECKISVADFRSDITSGKWMSYLQFAYGVTFAVPAGLITKADVPKGTGLIVRGEDGWKTLKAPTLAPVTLPSKTLLKLLMDGKPRLDVEPRPRVADVWRTAEKIRTKFGDKIGKVVGDIALAEIKLAEAHRAEKKILEEARQRAAVIRSQAVDHSDELEKLRLSLCGLLRIDKGSDWWRVVAAARAMRQDLDQQALVASLRMKLSTVRRAVDGLDLSEPAWVAEEASNG